jgi:hypothetical protein
MVKILKDFAEFKAGYLTPVDPAIARTLIAEGVAEAHSPGIHNYSRKIPSEYTKR